ncbi:MAG TPA: hypothetical protein VGM10_26150 [Actinocrinis sp.]|jgi:hypothetical protein
MTTDRAAPPIAAAPIVQVVAYVDQQRCTHSAVGAAGRAAVWSGLPLVVVYKRPRIPVFSQMMIPNVQATYEEIDCVVFDEVARLVAPFGAAWDFRAVPAGVALDRALSAGELRVSRVYVAGRHRGHLLAPLQSLRAGRALARLRRAAPGVETVHCGTAGPQRQAAAIPG